MLGKSATFRQPNDTGTLAKIRKKIAGLKRHSVAEESLPDGSFSPRKVPQSCLTDCTEANLDPLGFDPDPNDPQLGVAPVKYVGSFLVIGDGQSARISYVQSQLENMQTVFHDKPVLLVVCLAGIKVCSNDGKIIHMAHALKRISYATCNPDQNQFAFLAREPRHNYNVQYCHVFRTGCPEQAMEINGVVGNAFRSATERKLAGQTCLDDSFSGDKRLSDQSELKYLLKGNSVDHSVYNRNFGDDLVKEDLTAVDHKVIINVVRPMVKLAEESDDLVDHKILPNCSQVQVELVTTSEPNEAENQLILPSILPLSEEEKTVDVESNDQYETVDTLRRKFECEKIVKSAKVPQPPNSPPPLSPPTVPMVDSTKSSKFAYQSAAPIVDTTKSNFSTYQSAAPMVDTANSSKLAYLSTSPMVDTKSAKFAYQSVANPFDSLILLQAGVDQKLTNPVKLPSAQLCTDDLHTSLYRSKPQSRQRRPQSCQLPASLNVGWKSAHPTSIPEESEFNAVSSGENLPKQPQQTGFRRLFNRIKSAANLFDRHSVEHREAKRSTSRTSLNFGSTLQNNSDYSGAQQAYQPQHNSTRLRSGLSFPLSSLRDNLKLPNLPTKKRQRPLSELFISTNSSSSNGHFSQSPPIGPVDKQLPMVNMVRPVVKRVEIGRKGSKSTATQSLFVPVDHQVNSHSSLSQNAFDSGFDLSCRSSLTGSSLGSCSAEGISPISTEDFRRVSEAEWYCGGVNRQLVTEVLRVEPIGSFVVRQSSQPGCLALSVKVPPNTSNVHNVDGVSHYLIIHTAIGGYRLKGFTKEFPSVHSLVTHHSILAEKLPCRLIFTRRPKDSWMGRPLADQMVDNNNIVDLPDTTASQKGSDAYGTVTVVGENGEFVVS